MENYVLGEDEVVLYKGNVLLPVDNVQAQLLLTNLYIAIIPNNQDENEGQIVVSDLLPCSDVKIYEGVPQVKKDKLKAEIYLKFGEREFLFENKKELNKFTDAISTLLTGKNKGRRIAEKVNGAIGCINAAFDIDLVKSVGELIKTAVVNSSETTGKAIGDNVSASIVKKIEAKFEKKHEKETKKIEGKK